jgi:nicotinamide phosphoribosyltransferase
MPDAVIGSISALAHKVTQQYESEFDCFVHTIDETAKSGEKIVAMVIDTYDAWNVINNWVVPLTQYAKEKGVKVVWRPDSGDVFKQAVAIYEIAKKNELDNIAVIIGEGMSFEEVKNFDKMFEIYAVPLNFISYGIGAGFYKTIERDTLGWAMKTAYSNGEPRMKLVKSNPFKQSIPNRVHLTYNDDGELMVCDGANSEGIYYAIYSYLDESDAEYAKFLGISLLGDRVFCAEYDSQCYEEISEYALMQDTSQERIILSKETQDLIRISKEVWSFTIINKSGAINAPIHKK